MVIKKISEAKVPVWSAVFGPQGCGGLWVTVDSQSHCSTLQHTAPVVPMQASHAVIPITDIRVSTVVLQGGNGAWHCGLGDRRGTLTSYLPLREVGTVKRNGGGDGWHFSMDPNTAKPAANPSDQPMHGAPTEWLLLHPTFDIAVRAQREACQCGGELAVACLGFCSCNPGPTIPRDTAAGFLCPDVPGARDAGLMSLDGDQTAGRS